MIDTGKTIVFICDGCPEQLDTEESDFALASMERKNKGWLAFRDKRGEWNHYCSECQRKIKRAPL